MFTKKRITLLLAVNSLFRDNMSETEVISVRVRKGTKKTLEEMGVNITEEVRSFLEELAWKAKIKRKIEEWRSILERTKPSEKGFSVKSLREDRDSR